MVFLTNAAKYLYKQPFISRPGGVDKFWRKHMYFRMAWHYRGRKRHCFSLCVRTVRRAMRYSSQGRRITKDYRKKIWNMRLQAAASEHGLDLAPFLEGLARSNIRLNRKVLGDLAIYEPSTFKSLVAVSQQKLSEEGLQAATLDKPHGVITRGML